MAKGFHSSDTEIRSSKLTKRIEKKGEKNSEIAGFVLEQKNKSIAENRWFLDSKEVPQRRQVLSISMPHDDSLSSVGFRLRIKSHEVVA